MIAAQLCLAAVVAWLSLSSSAPPAGSPDLVVMRQARSGMGTVFQATVAARGRSHADLTRVTSAALDEVERLEQLLSDWRPGTEISELNRLAGTGAATLSPETYDALAKAKAFSELSGGAFDVTFNALWGLWDFKSPHPRLPDPAEVACRVALIDHRRLRLDPRSRTARLERAGMKVGLGGIGQGIAVDRICAMLDAAGLPDHLVDGGGDVKTCGTRGSAAWTIGLRHPRRDALLCMVEAPDHAVVTSGDYERYFDVDGRRYHHIIDPRTGYPARGVVSATIVARTATEADALTKALFVLGPERGMALLERLPSVEGLLVDEELRMHASSGLSMRAGPDLPTLVLVGKRR